MAKLGATLLFSLIAIAYPATATSSRPLTPCRPSMPVHTICSIKISTVHPTQLAVGMIEVNKRKEKLQEMDREELEEYVHEHQIPIVFGPGGFAYATDHHHFLLAYAKLEGRDSWVEATVEQNWTSFEPAAFWEKMDKASYTYLFDGEGRGPLPISSLPTSVFQLQNDPWRALAWGVRKDDGYLETTFPHADFLWGNFFRTRIRRELIERNFKRAVEQGVALAATPEASHLPGYLGGL